MYHDIKFIISVFNKILLFSFFPPLLHVLRHFSVFLTKQKNKICLWHLGMQESMERDEMDDALEPALKCEADHNGDVTGLEVSGGSEVTEKFMQSSL